MASADLWAVEGMTARAPRLFEVARIQSMSKPLSANKASKAMPAIGVDTDVASISGTDKRQHPA